MNWLLQKEIALIAFLKSLFASSTPFGSALYDDAVRQSRQPVFFREHGVPDALDGRFDLIVLHLCLLRFGIVATGEEPGDGKMLRAMDERFVMDMDHALREIGVGDLSVGKNVKKMMGAYNGRWTAYLAAFEAVAGGGDTALLRDALARNVYRDESREDVAGLLGYTAAQIRHLKDKGGVIRSTQATPWAQMPA